MSINISVTNTDDFPSLGKKTVREQTKSKRSSSALSSQSSASFGSPSPSVVKTVIQNGDYFATEDATLRPFLKCFCNTCGGQWLRESRWTTNCEKAFVLKKGSTVKVVKSKVVHHKVGFKHERFSIALVQIEDPEMDLEYSSECCVGNQRVPWSGWVMSKTLKIRGAIRSQSAVRKAAQRGVVDHSRSRSVSVANSTQGYGVFQFGEPVIVQLESGDWVEATVKSEDPLLVSLEGDSQTYPVHIEFIKKCPTTKFVLTCDAKVRSTEFVDNWDQIATLKKGTVVSITHMSGYEGRITAPVVGWVTMRSKHRLNMIEPTWKYKEQKPTIVVKNLPSTITEKQLTRALRMKARCKVLNVKFLRLRGENRALVEVDFRGGCQLVDTKAMELSYGWSITFKWHMDFLLNRAAQNLFN